MNEPLDLFKSIVEDAKQHPNFRNTLREKDPHVRDVLTQWSRGFVDRDGKFVREFQTSFNSSFWELYLNAALREFGFHVHMSHPAPDFLIEKGAFCASIEATTANNSADTAPEWDIQIADVAKADRARIVDLATIRLANALIAKSRKYDASYSQLSHVRGRPFVLAIAPFEQPMFWAQNDQAMRRVLYGYDVPIYTDYPEENRRDIHGHKYIESIEKPNGAEVPLGYFVTGTMPEISAVIFSNTATFGKARALSADMSPIWFEHLRYNANGLRPHHRVTPKSEYQETLLDGLHIYHNPTARFPIDPEVFRHPDVAQHWYSLDLRYPITDCKDGALIQRSVIKLSPKPREPA